MRKVLIICSSGAYCRMFRNHGYQVLESITEALPDLVCFTGGSDVSPLLYGEAKHPTTFNDVQRDREEKDIFLQCVELDIPVVGICRGGQFLNVMNGGKMFQDVSRHTRYHPITDIATDKVIFATSTHHQMMRPGPRSVLLAYANEGGYKEHMDRDGIVVYTQQEKDAEVVFYPDTSSLCFQPHPEFDGEVKLQEYFFSLIDKHLFTKE